MANKFMLLITLNETIKQKPLETTRRMLELMSIERKACY